jgi:hypothetical protein
VHIPRDSSIHGFLSHPGGSETVTKEGKSSWKTFPGREKMEEKPSIQLLDFNTKYRNLRSTMKSILRSLTKRDSPASCGSSHL